MVALLLKLPFRLTSSDGNVIQKLSTSADATPSVFCFPAAPATHQQPTSAQRSLSKNIQHSINHSISITYLQPLHQPSFTFIIPINQSNPSSASKYHQSICHQVQSVSTSPSCANKPKPSSYSSIPSSRPTNARLESLYNRLYQPLVILIISKASEPLQQTPSSLNYPYQPMHSLSGSSVTHYRH